MEPVSAQEAGDRVPPAVRDQRVDLQRCPSCQRIYGDGSHTARMRADLAQVLADAGSGPGGAPVRVDPGSGAADPSNQDG